MFDLVEAPADGLGVVGRGELELLFREAEVQRRRWDARVAAIVGEAERQQVYVDDGHVSVAGWCRTVGRWSTGQCVEFRRLARLLRDVPAIAEAAAEGRIGSAQLGLLARARA